MAWLSGFDQRIKITIDKDQIDEELTDFPTPIYLSALSGPENDDVSAIFDELTSDSNRKKIAITTSDELTQCYVEIERWDDVNEKAWLHVKVPTIVSGTDTELYIYYDSTHADNTTYVGDVGDTPAQSVWDNSFKAVYHLGEDPYYGIGDCDASLLDEDMAVITDWTDGDAVNGESIQTTFDSKSCMMLDGNTAGSGNYAFRQRTLGALGNRVITEINLYCDLVGTQSSLDYASFQVRKTGVLLLVQFASDGLFVYDGASYNEVGTNLVVQDTWQKWTFDADFTTPASATVDIYLDDELVAEGVDCSYTGSFTEGNIRLYQYGENTSDVISYIDYIKIGATFDNNIKDSTSNVNHGTPAGSMASEDLVDGKFGKALDFDGSDDYINCGSDTSLDDITTKTVEAIIYLDTFGEFDAGRIVQKANINTDGWNLLVQAPENRLYFGQDWNGVFSSWTTGNSTLSTSTWYGVAVTYDLSLTTNDPLLYIDGTSVTLNPPSTPTGSADSDATNDMWIGARSNSGPDREFNGRIDSLRISSIIRTDAWINATYEGLWDNLLSFGDVIYSPGITCSGTVQIDDIFTPGIDVRLYRRSTGEFVGATTTISGGLFEIESSFSEDHYVVALYTVSGTNALIYDYIHP